MGLTCTTPKEAYEMGFIGQLVKTEGLSWEEGHPLLKDTDGQVLYQHALKHIDHYASLPWQARADAKSKLVAPIRAHMNEKGLDEVVRSITGDEFQKTANGILKALADRKKK